MCGIGVQCDATRSNSERFQPGPGFSPLLLMQEDMRKHVRAVGSLRINGQGIPLGHVAGKKPLAVQPPAGFQEQTSFEAELGVMAGPAGPEGPQHASYNFV